MTECETIKQMTPQSKHSDLYIYRYIFMNIHTGYIYPYIDVEYVIYCLLEVSNQASKQASKQAIGHSQQTAHESTKRQ